MVYEPVASDSMRNISQQKVNGLALRVPSLDEQRRIVAEVEQQLSLIDSFRTAVVAAQRRSAALRSPPPRDPRARLPRRARPAGPGRRAGVRPARAHPRRARRSKASEGNAKGSGLSFRRRGQPRPRRVVARGSRPASSGDGCSPCRTGRAAPRARAATRLRSPPAGRGSRSPR